MPYGEQFVITRGDTEPALEITARLEVEGVPEDQWAPIDWTGATAVQFRMKPLGSDGPAVVVGAGAFGSPRTGGKLSYAWQPGDTDRPSGLYEAKFTVTTAGGGTRSAPSDGFIEVNVTPNV